MIEKPGKRRDCEDESREGDGRARLTGSDLKSHRVAKS